MVTFANTTTGSTPVTVVAWVPPSTVIGSLLKSEAAEDTVTTTSEVPKVFIK